MNNLNIEKELMTEYAKNRSLAINKAKTNFSIAMKNVDFAKTYQEIRNLDLEIAKQAVTKQDPSFNKKKLSKLKKELLSITKKLNFSPEDFKPKFKCLLCNDTGKVNNEKCECFKKAIMQKIIKKSGILIDTKHTFAEFDENIAKQDEQKIQLSKMKNFFILYAEKFPNVKYKNILLCGNTGVGKTFLLECLANELIKKEITLNFISAFQMNSLFVNYHTTFTEEKHNYLSSLLSPEVLIIDDLGTEPINKNVTKEYLYTVLSERMNQNYATIISTNLMPEDILYRYGERIFSRLSFKTKSTTILLKGDDLRLNK